MSFYARLIRDLDCALAPRGACGHCGGAGEVPERLDDDRLDVMVPCYSCRKYCPTCKAWVKKEGHVCK